MSSMNCVVIDDEPLAQEGMSNYVREVEFLNLIGVCENPVQLMPILDQQRVDLILLDIHMPKMSGIDFLKSISNPPIVLITTAYPNFALESFQLSVLDYMVKPITFERFFSAAIKARDYYKLLNASSGDSKALASAGGDYFFVKCSNKYEKIFFSDISFIEGLQNYVVIHTDKSKYTTLLTLKNLEEKLDPQRFLRVHKSFIVAVDKVDGLEGHEIFIKSDKIPIGRNNRDLVIEKVLAKKVWERK